MWFDPFASASCPEIALWYFVVVVGPFGQAQPSLLLVFRLLLRWCRPSITLGAIFHFDASISCVVSCSFPATPRELPSTNDDMNLFKRFFFPSFLPSFLACFHTILWGRTPFCRVHVKRDATLVLFSTFSKEKINWEQELTRFLITCLLQWRPSGGLKPCNKARPMRSTYRIVRVPESTCDWSTRKKRWW